MNAYQMLIDGKWKSNGHTMPVVSPANEEVIATVPVASADDVQLALDSAFKAQKEWGKRSGVERGLVLRRLAELVERDKDRLARLLSQEQGNRYPRQLGRSLLARAGFPITPSLIVESKATFFRRRIGTNRYGLFLRPWEWWWESFPGIFHRPWPFARLRPR